MLAAAYHLGADRAAAQGTPSSETAVLSGTLADGATIPLPSYSDGAQATQDECHWIASPHEQVMFTNPPVTFHCSAENRVVHVYVCASDPANCVPSDPTFSHGTADYLIVATRATGAVDAQRRTLGKLKARYR